jgi:hypothetical protein
MTSQGLAIVLLVYVVLGMARLALILYIRLSRRIQDWNDKLFDAARMAGPLSYAGVIVAEILLWPYGLYLGYHLVLEMKRAQRREMKYREKCARETLAALAKGGAAPMPPRFRDSHQEISDQVNLTVQDIQDQAAHPSPQDPADVYDPGTFRGLSDDFKEKIAKKVQEDIDRAEGRG